ncbi:Hsp70 family protein, partial [Actinoplanes sp. NPDC005259]
MYALGIDLGTTFTAAAIWRDGRAETVSLGDRSAAIPSVVLLRQDETFLTGDAAHRRGFSEPQRVAREFKRRLGDTTPFLLGGVPQSAEALMSRLLRWVVDEVTRREGGAPAAICITHPANWGPYKMDLMRQAARMADLDLPVTYTTEPEAAAVNYTQQQRVEQGSVVAVYDLGGGTFDAAVLRKTATGFEVMGQPEGIERLGGTDFDAAVFNHVRAALDGKLEALDEDDTAAINAVARLRDECVQAKEALSSDTDTTIPVLLPEVSTEVRLTRAEFEAMVRPALHGSVEALQRALRSADCTPEQVRSVLLVGGSSRMPIVAQLVGSELGRPVVVDAHPKHSVALGAAWLAGAALAKPAGAAPVSAPPRQQAAPATPATRPPRRTVPPAQPAASGTPAARPAAVPGIYRAEPAAPAPVPAPRVHPAPPPAVAATVVDGPGLPSA